MPVTVEDGIGWQVVLDRKRAWILALEIADPDTFKLIDQLEPCSSRLKLLLK
jgi:hypothetical protein